MGPRICGFSVAATLLCLAGVLLAVPRPAHALDVGVALPDSLDFGGDERAYTLTLAAGEHLLVLVEKDSGWYGHLYIRRGRLPTTSVNEGASAAYGGQAVEVALTEDGACYYVMLTTIAQFGDYTIEAHTYATLPELTLGTGTGDALGLSPSTPGSV